MSLPKELVETVVCPRCKGRLDVSADDGAFACKACSLVYPVVEGTPNFIITEARTQDGATRS